MAAGEDQAQALVEWATTCTAARRFAGPADYSRR
jgi:hypothetical protein